MSATSTNTYLTQPLGVTYLKTALPIIFVMAVNGALAVADALFLGLYVGPEALAAVTLMFPLYMLIVSLATLVASGMSSRLARHLGAGDHHEAGADFAGAHGLAMALAATLIALFFLFGERVALLLSAGETELADLGLVYLRITALASPLMFVLSVNFDALRNEGKVALMTILGVVVTLANIGFNYLLIAHLDMGVAGSAYGTILAQLVSFTVILIFRTRGDTRMRPRTLLDHPMTSSWGRILALGAPQSLTFIGVALGSAVVIGALQLVDTPHYAETVSAYGIFTRVMTFCFMPLLGLSHAMQTITGNNFGAKAWPRSNSSLKIATIASLVYCGVVQFILTVFAWEVGAAFIDDPAVISEVVRIMPIVVSLFVLAGPSMMIGRYFQAIGDAGRAALLGLAKPFLFAIPLTFVLAMVIGEYGIWLAAPVAEVLLALMIAGVLVHNARKGDFAYGVFHPVVEGQS
ncbi:MAG: MATE family efflux transporter [Pelagimonas sp.]|uniref:MATE family efflux transporter n=1 Tax=Pelagimonas sp. TaxID=2073170 RepID=UPI003D6A3FE9